VPVIILDSPFSDEIFFKTNNYKNIKNSPNNSTIVFENAKIEDYLFCKKNNIPYGAIINSIKEFIFLINLKAKYSFCKELELAKTLQKIADNYLTETKVILITKNYDKIEEIVSNEIDGIITNIKEIG
jgi:hypothetical protein